MSTEEPMNEEVGAEPSTSSSDQEGVVYIIVNEAMPGYVKIGETRNLDQRMQSLYSTPVPLPFEVIYAARVADRREVERALHDAFNHCRVSKGREYFRIDEPGRLIRLMKVMELENVTPQSAYIEDEDDRRALETSKVRNRWYDLLRAEDGETLVLKDDPAYNVTIRRNGGAMECELPDGTREAFTPLTKRLAGIDGHGYGIRERWLFRGRCLEEIYLAARDAAS